MYVGASEFLIAFSRTLFPQPKFPTHQPARKSMYSLPLASYKKLASERATSRFMGALSRPKYLLSEVFVLIANSSLDLEQLLETAGRKKGFRKKFVLSKALEIFREAFMESQMSL